MQYESPTSNMCIHVSPPLPGGRFASLISRKNVLEKRDTARHALGATLQSILPLFEVHLVFYSPWKLLYPGHLPHRAASHLAKRTHISTNYTSSKHHV